MARHRGRHEAKNSSALDKLPSINATKALGRLVLGGALAWSLYEFMLPGMLGMPEVVVASMTDMTSRESAIAKATTKAVGTDMTIACVGPIMDRYMHIEGALGVTMTDKDGDTIPGTALLRRDVCNRIWRFRAGEDSFEAYQAALVPVHEGAHSNGIDDESDADCAALRDYLGFAQHIGRTAKIDPNVWQKVDDDTRLNHPDYYDEQCFADFAATLNSKQG